MVIIETTHMPRPKSKPNKRTIFTVVMVGKTKHLTQYLCLGGLTRYFCGHGSYTTAAEENWYMLTKMEVIRAYLAAEKDDDPSLCIQCIGAFFEMLPKIRDEPKEKGENDYDDN
jgi:hypothetical protein